MNIFEHKSDHKYDDSHKFSHSLSPLHHLQLHNDIQFSMINRPSPDTYVCSVRTDCFVDMTNHCMAHRFCLNCKTIASKCVCAAGMSNHINPILPDFSNYNRNIPIDIITGLNYTGGNNEFNINDLPAIFFTRPILNLKTELNNTSQFNKLL